MGPDLSTLGLVGGRFAPPPPGEGRLRSSSRPDPWVVGDSGWRSEGAGTSGLRRQEACPYARRVPWRPCADRRTNPSDGLPRW
jgi:hypothetical protein